MAHGVSSRSAPRLWGRHVRPGGGQVHRLHAGQRGGEFFQHYRQDFADGRATLLKDGKSRNLTGRWSKNGKWLTYTSTRRNGRDTDLYVMNPRDPRTDRLLAQVKGGGWNVQDWTPNDTKLLVREYISVNESRLHLCDFKPGAMQRPTPPSPQTVSWNEAVFAKDGQSLYAATDKDSEFLRLCRLDLATQKLTPLAPNLRGDVETLDLARDGRTLAFVINQDGASVLHLLDVRSGKELKIPKLPSALLLA